MKESHIWK